jgi:hypothetical protein
MCVKLIDRASCDKRTDERIKLDRKSSGKLALADLTGVLEV